MQKRVAAGLAHWPALAGLAGLPADGWEATLLWSRQDDRGDRTVVRLDRDGLPPVVVKQSHRTSEAANMAAGLAGHARAAQALADHPEARVPRILAYLPDHRAALIEAVPGQALVDLAQGEGATGVVARAGRWLDAFHRSGAPAPGPFGPRVAARHALRSALAVGEGKRQVAKPRLYAQHLASLQSSIKVLRDVGAVIAPRHGDFSGRNLLVGAHQVWGIDFGPDVRAPVATDIAKLLTFLALRTPAPVEDVLSEREGSLRAAFFGGYGLCAPSDPTVTFLIAAQLLADWAALPPDIAAMTPAQDARFRRIVGLLAALSAGT